MNFLIRHFEFGQRPPVTLPTHDFLTYLTEKGIRKMVSDHYDLIKQSSISSQFPPIGDPLEKSKLHSSDFFIQICGGPAYYLENRGQPMMVKRHAPIKITAEVREEWLQCYITILSKLELPEEVILSFWNYLNVFSWWMVNSESKGD